MKDPKLQNCFIWSRTLEAHYVIRPRKDFIYGVATYFTKYNAEQILKTIDKDFDCIIRINPHI